MASFAGVSAAAKSIERLFNGCFAASEAGTPEHRARAHLIRTEDLVRRANGTLSFTVPALTVFTYRVDFNKTMRAAWSGVGSLDGRGHLPLDMHLLITPWADNAEDEHRILGKAMECVEATPILSGPLLSPEPAAGWAASEAIQLVLEDLGTEAVMRIFDSLPTDYKLSVPYIARIVRIDTRTTRPTPPITEVVYGLASGPRPPP